MWIWYVPPLDWYDVDGIRYTLSRLDHLMKFFLWHVPGFRRVGDVPIDMNDLVYGTTDPVSLELMDSDFLTLLFV
jgi:hypothetical protein